MRLSRDINLAGILLVFMGLVLLGLNFFFSGTFDAGDSIMHYQIAHHAPGHPELYLDLWGKPAFTLLASPFAVWGWGGMLLFNGLCGLLSGWLAWKSAQKLGYTNPWLALLLLFGAPAYLLAMRSGLTEPLFGLFTMLGLYTALNGKVRLSFLLISVLPFVRSEGFIVLVIYLAWGVLRASKNRRAWMDLPWLLAGCLGMAGIGLLVFGEPLWFLSQNPYGGELENYGSGDWGHFPQQFFYIVGLPVYIFTALGLLAMLIKIPLSFVSTVKDVRHLPTKVFLVYGTFAGYFAAHMYFWATGSFHSMGLSRVMVAILPVGALIGLEGFQFLSDRLPNHRLKKGWLGLAAVALLLFPVSGAPAGLHLKDLRLKNDQQIIIEASEWLQNQYPEIPGIWASHPQVALALDRDPWLRGQDHYEDMIEIAKGDAPQGTLLLWDSWFAVREAGVQRDYFDTRPDQYQLLKEWKSDEPYFEFRVFLSR